MSTTRHDQRDGLSPISSRSRVRNTTPKILCIQREIIDEGKTLGETAAGIAIAGDIYKVRQEHEQQLRDLEKELKSTLAKMDASHAAELQSLKSDLQDKMTKAEEEKKALHDSMVEMHKKEENAWIEKMEVPG
ncbi:hypothetical protein BJX70DRAFT_401470 [Aspergillus crustosus]